MAIEVVKASGEREPFSEEKLIRSLRRAGADAGVAADVAGIVKANLSEGMATKKIYDLAYATLRAKRRSIASRYSLKRALMEMGPSGHPFEWYVSELMKARGYSVRVAQTVPGLCVVHEVDVVAEKGAEHVMVECKYHNHPGTKSDVKVALYVHARFEDIRKRQEREPASAPKFRQAWLVTNTELTTDAVRYAECAGMKALGWNYPEKDGLQSWIESSGLHPITCLTVISKTQKKYLLENNIILCRGLREHEEILNRLNMSRSQKSLLWSEVDYLCGKSSTPLSGLENRKSGRNAKK